LLLGHIISEKRAIKDYPNAFGDCFIPIKLTEIGGKETAMKRRGDI